MERPWVTSPSYKAALDVLVKAREEAGLTQRQLAERLGKPRSFVSKVESRERRLDVVELVAWARALSLTATGLIEDIELTMGDVLEF